MSLNPTGSSRGGVDGINIPPLTLVDSWMNEVLDLEGVDDELAGPLLREYKVLQHNLRAACAEEARVQARCRAFAKDYDIISTKLSALIGLHKTDLAKREGILQTIEEAEEQIAELQNEFRVIKAKVENKRQAIDVLTTSLEQGVFSSVQAKKEELAAERTTVAAFRQARDKDRAGLNSLRAKILEKERQLREVEKGKRATQKELDELDEKIFQSKLKLAEEQREKKELHRDTDDVEAAIEAKEQEEQEKVAELAKYDTEYKETQLRYRNKEKEVNSQRVQFEKIYRDAEIQHQKLVERQDKNSQLALFVDSEEAELSAKKDRLEVGRAKTASRLKQCEFLEDKVREISEKLESTLAEKQSNLQRHRRLKLEIADARVNVNQISKAVDSCVKEREILSHNHMIKTQTTKQKENLLKISRSTLESVRNEHTAYECSVRSLNQLVERVKKEKSVSEADLQRRKAMHADIMKELKQMKKMKDNLAKSQARLDQRMRREASRLEQVKLEYKTYKRALTEQKSQFTEYSDKYKDLQWQIGKLKAELADKDNGFMEQHRRLKNVQNAISKLTSSTTRGSQRIRILDTSIREQDGHIKQLCEVISAANDEVSNQTKDYNSIVNDQRLLNEQLVERNRELAELYEKLRLQESLRQKSFAEYQKIDMLLTALHAKRGRLEEALEKVGDDVARYGEMKQEIAAREKEITQERLKIRALQDAVNHPMNVHRWRTLKDTNAESYVMIKRVRRLQEAIVRKSSEVEQRDEKIQEQEKLYIELRNLISRQPGSEAAEQIKVYRSNVREKQAKLKKMRAELRLFQNQVDQYKFDIQKLDADIQMCKLEYFASKRKKMQQRARQIERAHAWGVNPEASAMPQSLLEHKSLSQEQQQLPAGQEQLQLADPQDDDLVKKPSVLQEPMDMPGGVEGDEGGAAGM